MKALEAFVLSFVLVACNDSGFTGANGKGPGNKGNANGDSADGVGADGGLGTGDDAVAADGASVCVNEEVPVRLMISLDTTGSMEASMNFVATSVQNIAAALQTIVPKGGTKPLVDVATGLVFYKDWEDGAPQVVPVTKDIAVLKAEIDKRKNDVGGGGDQPEAGLYAFQMALNELEKSPKGAVTLVMTITDNHSHNDKAAPGIGMKHDYDLTSTLANFSKPLFDRLFIYDVTPNKKPETPDIGIEIPIFDKDAPWPLPADQWNAIRKGWKEKHTAAKYEPGKGFGFPFPSGLGGGLGGGGTPPAGSDVDKQIVEALKNDLQAALSLCK